LPIPEDSNFYKKSLVVCRTIFASFHTGNIIYMTMIIKTTNIPALISRITVGLVFISEGIQKFIRPDEVGARRFAKIGFSNPEFWAQFTACFEIICGGMILAGFLTRLAAIPLLIIMSVAFVTTKYPILIEKGFWSMAHEYRTDFVMTMLLIFLLIYGGGSYSIDKKIANS
jgi:putative oxidoreductase